MNSLLKTVARQRRDCDLNPGPSAPESSTLTTRLPSMYRIVFDFSPRVVIKMSENIPAQVNLTYFTITYTLLLWLPIYRAR